MRGFARKIIAIVSVGSVILCAAATANASLTPVFSWKEVSTQVFFGIDGVYRAQGVAIDDHSMYFTYNTGVTRTKLDGTTIEAQNLDAIPQELKDVHAGHIGDPDVYKGKLYLPIENDDFQHSSIAVFDADTLQYTGVKYQVPPGHIGWIALDPARGYAYYSDWVGAGTDTLKVLDMDDMSYVKTVQLSQSVDNNQGAAIHNGLLYASQDIAPDYPILIINPETGEVQTAFNRNFPSDGTTPAEAEGLAFLNTKTCSAMYVLEIAAAGGIGLRGYTPNGVPIPKVPGTAPAISGLRLKPGKVKRGKTTAMKFKIAKPARATVRISKYNPKADPCAKPKYLGTVGGGKVKAGKSTLKIRTKLKGKKLAPGKYQLSLSAQDNKRNINDSKKSTLSIIR